MSRDIKHVVERSQHRALQYEIADGTYELFFAVIFLLFSGIFILQATFTHSIWIDMLSGPGMLILVPGLAFLLDRLVHLFKERITYPRTGFIARKAAPETDPRLRRLIYIGVPILTLLILILISLRRPFQSPMDPAVFEAGAPIFAAFSALMLGGLWIILAVNLRLPRFFLTAVFTMLSGIAIFLARMDNGHGMAALFAAEALILGISGILVMVHYLLRNRTAPEEQA